MNGLTVYRKRSDADTWLMYRTPTKSWQIQLTRNKGTNYCYAFLQCDGPCLPENGPERTWRVWNKTGSLQLQAKVTVSIATLQQVQTYDDDMAAAAAALAERIRVDGFKVKIFLLLTIVYKIISLIFLILYNNIILAKAYCWSQGNKCTNCQRHLRSHGRECEWTDSLPQTGRCKQVAHVLSSNKELARSTYI